MATAENPYRPDLSVKLICHECRIDPPDIVERFAEGDMVCGNCGLVLSDRTVDVRSEWRTFANDDNNGDDPSRVGDAANPLLDGAQLSTIVAVGAPGQTMGRDLSRAQNRSATDRKDTTLLTAFGKISQMCEAFALPRTVQDSAKQVYKLVYDQPKLKSRTQQSILATAIFIGCRHAGVPRTFKEIAVLASLPYADIGKTFGIFERVLKKSAGNTLDYKSGQTRAVDLMRRFGSNLGLSMQVTRAAEYISQRVDDLGRSPLSVAAAAIYMSSALFGEAISAASIAEHTGVSDATMRTSYKILYEAKDKLIDPAWLESGKADLDRLPKIQGPTGPATGQTTGSNPPKSSQ